MESRRQTAPKQVLERTTDAIRACSNYGSLNSGDRPHATGLLRFTPFTGGVWLGFG